MLEKMDIWMFDRLWSQSLIGLIALIFSWEACLGIIGITLVCYADYHLGFRPHCGKEE